MYVHVYNLSYIYLCRIAEVQETDQDETDSCEQPRITSTSLKMQMTLRSMIDLGTYLPSNIP